MTTTPDTWFYYRLHEAMLDSSDRLAAAVADLAHDDRRRAAAQADWFDGFVAELRHHHEVEDHIFFPALAERVATFRREHEAVLADDHAHLDEVLDGLAAALRSLASGASWLPAHATAVALSAELRDHLVDHLALEDHEVIPLFERHFTAEEYEVLDKAAVKTTTLEQLRFTCPWIMAFLDDEGRARVFSGVPFAMKVIWWATRRGYARRAATAFGSTRAAALVG